MDADGYRSMMEEAAKQFNDTTRMQRSGRSSAAICFMSSARSSRTGASKIADRDRAGRTAHVRGVKDVFYYMAVPPSRADGGQKMKAHGLCKGTFQTRIVVEKPFGEDSKSAARAEQDHHRRLRREPDIPHRPLPGQGASRQHTSFSAFPTRSSRRSGTGATWTTCR